MSHRHYIVFAKPCGQVKENKPALRVLWIQPFTPFIIPLIWLIGSFPLESEAQGQKVAAQLSQDFCRDAILEARNHLNLAQIHQNSRNAISSLKHGFIIYHLAENAGLNMLLINSSRLVAEIYKNQRAHHKAMYFFEKCNQTQQDILDITHQRNAQIGELKNYPSSTEQTTKYASKEPSEKVEKPFLYWGLPLFLTGIGFILYKKRRKTKITMIPEPSKETIDPHSGDKYNIPEMIADLKNQLTILQNSNAEINFFQNRNQETGSESLKLSCQDLLNQTERIQYWNKLQEDGIQVNYSIGNLAERIQMLLAAHTNQADQKNIQWILSNQSDPIHLQFDFGLVDRIFENLMCFITEFTPAGASLQMQLDLQDIISSPLEEKKGMYAPPVLPTHSIFTCTITNPEGIQNVRGVSKIIMNKGGSIQLSGDRKSDLRLEIAMQIIRSLNGTLSIEKRGWFVQQVRFCWPVFKIPKDPRLQKTSAHQLPNSQCSIHSTADPSLPQSPEKKQLPQLLLIESNKYLSELIRNSLKDECTLEIHSGDWTRLEDVNVSLPDLIICDGDRTENNHLKWCEEIKNNPQYRDVPIILLSSKNEISEKVAALNIGIDGYLTKPFYLIELKAQISHLLKSRAKDVQEYHPNQVLTQNDLREVTEDPFLMKVNQFIYESIDQRKEISIEGLSQYMTLSRMQLHRKIKVATGQSAALYIRSIKLNKARILLQYHKLNVTEAAYSVGFEDPKYFSRVYHGEFGSPPSRTNFYQSDIL